MKPFGKSGFLSSGLSSEFLKKPNISIMRLAGYQLLEISALNLNALEKRDAGRKLYDFNFSHCDLFLFWLLQFICYLAILFNS